MRNTPRFGVKPQFHHSRADLYVTRQEHGCGKVGEGGAELPAMHPMSSLSDSRGPVLDFVYQRKTLNLSEMGRISTLAQRTTMTTRKNY